MIGKTLKYMRINKKLNQIELSKIINIKQNTLSRYENEIADINFETIEKIASICDFNIIFENRITKEKFQAKDLIRKDF